MKFPKRVTGLFLKVDGTKDKADKKSIFLSCVAVVVFGVAITMWLGSKEDTSVVINSTVPIKNESKKTSQEAQGSPKVNGMLDASAQAAQAQSRRNHSGSPQRYVKNIEYKATQVIERKGPDGLERGLPLGTNLVGKLLTAIDTRETDQIYKVLLPYGGKDKNGGSVPKNTIVFGKISYPGMGEKVFIQFTQGLLPDGREVKLKAQALNSKDYSPGLMGDFHGKRTERIAATLGLTMVSAMTDTLTEREALGSGGSNGSTIAVEATPKANAKNAFYQGISKVSEMEAGRQASELSDSEEYVTIPAGKEMIVNLVSTYYGEQQ
ncbi:MAG: hypothetical protein H6626_02910 [Pseudobdellovibrionaceae bacterium]|nr:MAG: hypothetical protein H6626_02910 [Pseudobdellovibrionaceae bacterium]